ncbi:hypothetical protein CK203_074684 [Vitis vinifera]|uniref:Uncharacterized protein n=1 Tax=Vitis vinifera TaxID=29760 RepID=A0A438DWA4_VITVI|nr:hypothetical protein CK203_074684 [Vitis vinifera]
MEGWITWEELSHEWGCRVGELPSPYLGLPLDAPFKSMAVWDEIEVFVLQKIILMVEGVGLETFFNTLICNASDHTTGSHDGGKGVHLVLVIMVSALVSIVSVLAVVAVYKYWQKRKREQDQARFLKLFEDGDDIEDELAL